MKIRYFLGVLMVWLTFSAIGQDYQDQAYAFNVCDSKSFCFEQMQGTGEILEKVGNESCFGNSFYETNSKWLRWKAESSGKLIFSTLPSKQTDDIDFVVFISIEEDLIPIRCMASGQSLHQSIKSSCIGPTGLAYTSKDESEVKGCQQMDDNFLKFIEMNEGDEYYLLINNYNSAEGFTITFESTADLVAIDNCSEEKIPQTLQLERIYPVPAHDQVNIEYTNEMDYKVDFVVYNVFGQQVLSFSHQPSAETEKIAIDIQAFPKGEYILSATQNGKKATKQFLKI